MTLNFSAQVSDIVRRNEIKVDALIKTAVQDVIDDAQLSDDKGGRMRVDTGFLRASGQISLTGMPSGPERGEATGTYNPADENVALTLAGVKAGDTVYFGWTANYAAAREFYDGFLSGAVQKWQRFVDAACKRLSE